jgi:citrate lyase subunit beta/citryl-CoA lyase
MLMRSKLFVPGDRPELFAKALASSADAVCFDLEDAVLPAHKLQARTHISTLLNAPATTGQLILVRVNGLNSPYIADDLSAVTCSALAMLNLPKVEDPSEVEEVAAALLRLEKERKIERPISILANIESPRGLRLARSIAAASTRIAGLQLGLADFFEPLGIQRDDKAAAHHIRLQLRLAAGEAGVPCFDSAFPAFRDVEGFAMEAAGARNLGFSGKSCIHPCQIAPANRIFSPDAQEVALSLRILEAATAAANAGHGAFAFDGRMVDEPFVERARRVIQIAKATCPDLLEGQRS